MNKLLLSPSDFVRWAFIYDEILLKKSLISVKVNPNKLKINLNYQ